MSTELDKTREAAQHYDTVVEAWGLLLQEDLHYGYFETGNESLIDATDALTNEMLQLARLQPGQQVLDIGCGTGKAGCRIASEYSCQVIGISPSAKCIEDANAKARELGLADAVEFRIGDGMRPDFPDGTFDRVWVMESSHLMPDKKALLSECARVLKPGGRMVLCDVMLDHTLPMDEVIQNRHKFMLLKDVFGRAIMEPLDFYSAECEANGLRVDHCRNITTETLPTFDHWLDNANRNRDSVVGMIGEDACQQFADSCGVLRDFWQAGILGYGIISAEKPA